MPYSNDYNCTVEDCSRKRRTKLYCPTHNARFRKYGNPLGIAVRITKSCEIDSCSKKHLAKGMCSMHYRRYYLYGDANSKPGRKRTFNKIEVSVGGYIKLYEPEHPNANGDGYVLEHRKVMSDFIGRPLLITEQVHHKNGNRQDNHINNLEIWNTSQPSGQRVEDKIEYALQILRQYAPEKLA